MNRYLSFKFLLGIHLLMSAQHSFSMWKEASNKFKSNFENLVNRATNFSLSPTTQFGLGISIGFAGISASKIKQRVDQYNNAINQKLSKPLTTKGKSAAFEYAVRYKAFDILNKTNNFQKNQHIIGAGDFTESAITLAANDYLKNLNNVFKEEQFEDKVEHIKDNLRKYKQGLNNQKRDPIFSYYTNMSWYKKAWFGQSAEKWHIAPDYKLSERIRYYDPIAALEDIARGKK
ncbi:MAG: hypothetical protein ACOYT8_02890 [Candidatus Dependentiae bacterium]